MAVGGGGVEALFWIPPVTPGDVAAWAVPGVLMDGGAGGGGGGMSIGGAITSGTAGSALFVGPTGVLAQTAVPTLAGQVMTWNGTTWVPTAGGGGGMSIGGAVTGGTPGSVLFIGAGGLLAQDNNEFFWNDTTHILKQGATAGHYLYNIVDVIDTPTNFERGILDWNATANVFTIGTQAGGTGVRREIRYYTADAPALFRVPATPGAAFSPFNSDSWYFGGAASFSATGVCNVGIGNGALLSLTSGNDNFGLGFLALGSLTTGARCVGIGFEAASNLGGSGVTAADVIAIGYSALASVGTAQNTVAIGSQAGYHLSSPFGNDYNTLVGGNAGYNITGGSGNTIIGGWWGPSASVNNIIALATNTFGGALLALDYNYTKAATWSFQNLTTAQGLHVYNTSDGLNPPTNFERGVLDWNVTSNVFTIGTPPSSHGGTGVARETRLYTMDLPALYIVKNASGNNWFEGNAGNLATTGFQNFGTGDGCLGALTTGYENTGVGSNAMQNMQTGTNNFAIGTNALASSINAVNNIAIGANALAFGIGPYTWNIAIGANTLVSTGDTFGNGSYNVAIGGSAMNGNTIGLYNVAIGYSALSHNTVSSNNVVIGAQAALGLAGGGCSSNTFIGYSAASSITTGSQNTWIGGYAGTAATWNNTIVITDGGSYLVGVDYRLTNSGAWSFQNSGTPVGLHVYKTTDMGTPPTNFERGVLDWNVTSNVFTIGTQAGGTGTVRDMKFINVPNKTTPIGADHIYIADSTTSDTLKTALISSLPGGGGGMSIGGAVTSGTPGSVLFIDGSSNLAQDNANFFWDDSGYNFKLGHTGSTNITSIWLNGLQALYKVPNASGANWFEGNAGNISVTGNANFGTGDGSLGTVTTGYQNVAVGSQALALLTTGYNNASIGFQNLYNLTSGYENTSFGTQALYQCTTGNNNFALGSHSQAGTTDGTFNISIGAYSLYNNLHTNNNVAIGAQSLQAQVNCNGNVAIGYTAGYQTAGGFAPNIFIGYRCGYNLIGNSGANTWIGQVSGVSGTVSNSMVINDGNDVNCLFDFNYTTPYIYGLNRNFALGGNPTLAIYNTQDAIGPAMTAYERVMLGWYITSNIFRITSQAAGGGMSVRLIAIDGFQKAGAPAAGDLPSGTMALINDTSGGNTWLVYNAAGTIRKVQLV